MKELDLKMGQATFLTHSDFVTWKGVKTHLDALQVRFGSKLNARVLPFHLKTITNKITTMNEHINTKKVQSHNSIIEKQDHTKQTTAIESKH